ncbi:MAG: hypothetical protein OXC46_08020 [Thaumarchaeota archaeon]|nr:hypothetical protein [Nitrososphaerota archaeon]
MDIADKLIKVFKDHNIDVIVEYNPDNPYLKVINLKSIDVQILKELRDIGWRDMGSDLRDNGDIAFDFQYSDDWDNGSKVFTYEPTLNKPSH